MLLKSFVFFNFLVLFYMMVVQFIVLLVIYPLNRFCLRKLSQKYLNSKQQSKIEKYDNSFSYFKFNSNSPMGALIEGVLFFPEMVLSAAIAVITLCIIEIVFQAFGLDQSVFRTSNYEAIILTILIGIAIYIQLTWLNKRFTAHQLELRAKLQKLDVSEKYMSNRLIYDSVFNITFFTLGFMLWVPCMMMAIAATQFQLYFFEFSSAICLFLVVFAIAVRRCKMWLSKHAS